MLNIRIAPRDGDRRYEIHVADGRNGEKLLVSHQGYEDAVDAEDLVRRLFGSPRRLTEQQVRAGEALGSPESVGLTIAYRSGDTKQEMIR